jgi:hypothetical protein
MRRVSVVSVAAVVALAFAGAAWAGSPLDGLGVAMQLTPMTLGGYSDGCIASETGVTALSTVTGVSTVAPSAAGWTAATTPPTVVPPQGAPPPPPLTAWALLVWNAGGLYFLDSEFDVLSPTGDRYAVTAIAARFFTGCENDVAGVVSGATTSYPAYWHATLRNALGLLSSPVAWEGCGTLAVTAGAGGAYALGFTTTSGRAFDFTQPFECPPGFAAADTTPPILTVPTAVSADATGPNGAIVTYSARATDAVDGAVTPDCSPASGSTFPIGDTTVTCSATDSSHNRSAGQTFVVHVRGALEQLAALRTALTGYGPGASLDAKLRIAIGRVAVGDTRGACASLQAVANEVDVQAGKKLSVPIASSAAFAVDRIAAVVGCAL